MSEDRMPQGDETPLKRTPLHDLHVARGARMVPFAGYEMPVQYTDGILAEHRWTRDKAGLFDVSHMGQAALRGEDRVAALEALIPGDVAALAPGRMRYTMLTNDSGGILDDIIVTNVGDYLFLVVNAACKEADLAHIRAALPAGCELEELADRALLALQGPAAAGVIAAFAPGAEKLDFMTAAPFVVDGCALAITRSGYTGEDGFEISIPSADALRIAEMLLGHDAVAPIGLGARDSLRLEAGLCLYGHDIDTTTTPIEAGLAWTISKRRRAEGGFPGAARILKEIADGPARKRVGLAPEGKAPAREHAEVVDAAGNRVGTVTSGGFGPTVGAPVAMGYIDAAHAAVGTALDILVRDKPRPAKVAKMPFVPHRYYKNPKS
jgi:aminomethyltransferase